VIPVFDTNILIDIGKGYEEARLELARYKQVSISVITWIEVISGVRSPSEKAVIQAFLQQFITVPLTQEIAEAAADIRQRHRMKLPDAIIWATATVRGTLLVTRNIKDFNPDEPTIRVPYKI